MRIVTRYARRALTAMVLVVACNMAIPARAQKNAPDAFKAPPGFEVTLYADDDLAHNIFSMTIDAKGRVVAAGPGYVKILHDKDGDGRADDATLFSPVPKSGAHGLYFDGADLVCTGDNAVMRLIDADGDGRADNADNPLVYTNLRHPEHGANGVVKGPDGWYYVICGNDAGVTKDHAALPGSPVADPNMGAVVRISPDGKHTDVFAHGFRNPYDLAFNAQGNLFTVDADGERDQHLPWYAPNRLFDIAQGMHHGWVIKGWQRSWNRPASWPDNVERLVEIGRGSPTGVECYRHTAFPKRYHNGVFSLCWTLGRVYFFPMQEWGSTFATPPRLGRTEGGSFEVFMETTGTIGFAPVDMAVGPKGDLFIAIGGRGTRGGVFRVRYVGERPRFDDPAARDADTDLTRLLRAPQPLSSWSRAKWLPAAKKLGRESFEKAVMDDNLPRADRMRAVEVLVEAFGGVSIGLVEAMEKRTLEGLDLDPRQEKGGFRFNDDLERVVARLSWAISRAAKTDADAKEFLANHQLYKAGAQALSLWTYAYDTALARAAWEAYATIPPDYRVFKSYTPDWRGLNASDRRIRAAAIRIARLTVDDPRIDEMWKPHWRGREDNRAVRPAKPEPRYDSIDATPLGALAYYWVHGSGIGLFSSRPRELGDVAVREFALRASPGERRTASDQTVIDVIRLLQITLGDVEIESTTGELTTGYAARLSREQVSMLLNEQIDSLCKYFPYQESAEVRREAARLIGMLEWDAERFPGLFTQWTADSEPSDDIHYLMVLAQLKGKWAVEHVGDVAEAFARLHGKMRRRGYHPSRNWPLRVGELYVALSKREPLLHEVLIRTSDFGDPEHAMFVARMPDDLKEAGTHLLLGKALAAGEAARWDTPLVRLVGELPDGQGLSVLRRLWGRAELRDAIVEALAKAPDERDRGRFVESLRSPQPAVAQVAAAALVKLDNKASADEIGAAITLLREACADQRQARLRAAAVRLLEHWTDQRFEVDDKGDLFKAYAPWFDWFAKAHPAAARAIAGAGADWESWRKRLAQIDFDAGDAERGKVVFESRGCHLCHVAAGRLGPDLKGAAARFSREDLFAAIVDPNRQVAPLYRVEQVTTRGGDTYYGIPVYESPDGTILQTGPNQTVRITGDEFVSRSPSRYSLMPAGLLNGLSDAEVADMDAYLRKLE